LREGYVFNGRIMHSNLSIAGNLRNAFGFGDFFLKQIHSRVELDINIDLKNLPSLTWSIFLYFINLNIPKKSSLKRRHILNIFILDVITSYRGWRHYKGLPVRGQRTWTNHVSSFRSNTVLRNYKIKLAKKFYGNLPVYEINIALAAEQINLMWKIQWFNEWLSAKKSRMNFKGNANTIKIDLFSMANNQIMNPLKFKNMTKKQKQSFKKNHFSLGFDPGFTKPLLKDLYNSRIDSSGSGDQGSKLIFRKHESKKKRIVKKKIDVKTKKLSHDLKKKKKKSVWDV